MAASPTDKFHKTGAATKTTLAAPGKALAATSINVVSTTNWPTDTQVTLAIRKVQLVDGEYQEVAGSYAEFNGIASGTTVTNLALVYGTDQVYPAGTNTEVFLPVSAYAHNRMVDGFLIGHNQNGTHKAFVESAIVPTAAIQDSAVTTAKLADAGVTYAKLLSTIFSGQFTSYTNPGTAGGTFRYGNVGGIKFFFGRTASQAVGTGATSVGVTLPVGFFTNIDYSDAGYAFAGTDSRQFAYIGAESTTAIALTIQSLTNGSTQQTNLLVIGR